MRVGKEHGYSGVDIPTWLGGKKSDHTQDVLDIRSVTTDLARAGFHVIEDSNTSGRVSIANGGGFSCMEDRPLAKKDQDVTNGPNLVGGVFGLAALKNRGHITRKALVDAVKEIRHHGHTPTIHDTTDGETCGFAEQVFLGGIHGVQFDTSFTDIDSIYSFTQDVGARLVSVHGHNHSGQHVRFNLQAGTTFIADGTAFQTDLGELVRHYRLEQSSIVTLTSRTLAALHGPSYAYVVR